VQVPTCLPATPGLQTAVDNSPVGRSATSTVFLEPPQAPRLWGFTRFAILFPHHKGPAYVQ
jgi:hypothetical protein